MALVEPGIGLIFWMTVSFLIVLFLLGRFAWKPILSGIEMRNESIDDALKSAEKARREMENLKSENEKLLDEARLEREKLLKDAAAMADNIKEQAKQEAQKISQKIVEDARISIENEKQQALKEVKNQVVKFSLEIAEKLMKRNLSQQSEQKKLVDDFVNDLNLN
ncbi:MAG: F0F1 ATP synthase subunit B [Cyclobacteriaceae bacterium]